MPFFSIIANRRVCSTVFETNNTMGRGQAVRHMVLVHAFGGSNPSAPAKYTITAAEVKKLEDARKRKAQADRAGQDKGTDEEMGLREFIGIVLAWAWGVVRSRLWRSR